MHTWTAPPSVRPAFLYDPMADMTHPAHIPTTASLGEATAVRRGHWTTSPLGRSNVRVGLLALGTAPLGGMFTHVDDAEAIAVVRRAVELGIDYIDTAPQYGHGTAERRVGRALAAHPAVSAVVSTKVGRLIIDRAGADTGIFVDAPASDAVFDFSAGGIERSLRESLARLQLERVEIVYLHDPDDHADQAIAEAYPVLERLRAQGVVGAIGVGMNQTAIPLRFVRETDIDVVLLAGRWTLLDRSGGELLHECGQRGVSVVAGGVFNSGLLANPAAGATFDYQPADSNLVDQARALAAVCAHHGVSLQAAALQFPLRHRAVAAVLTGVRSVAELEANVAAFDLDLPDALWADLDGALATERAS